MSTTNTPTSIQRALGQGTPSDSASHCLLDNVDIMNSMPTLGNLIDHSVAPTIIAQASAPTPRLDRYPRRRSTQQKPILQLQLRPQVKAFRSTSKRSDRRRSRTYWPVWYQKQRRREYKEAVRNMKLDELRRLELMELWEEEVSTLAREMNSLAQLGGAGNTISLVKRKRDTNDEKEEDAEVEDQRSETIARASPMRDNTMLGVWAGRLRSWAVKEEQKKLGKGGEDQSASGGRSKKEDRDRK
ncbi:uncharacterized protein B0T23DRAFT_408291 [Neurospora hispaniola]|uniref:Uncharacterized protein n=1 Tax=Neurospora hispaniola TaxID=588809 RepID=A0AAJ0HYD7_9PEZI|nr:hypothetical protein B0T23DRAFT_408291 [Neurospora hispaniola]